MGGTGGLWQRALRRFQRSATGRRAAQPDVGQLLKALRAPNPDESRRAAASLLRLCQWEARKVVACATSDGCELLSAAAAEAVWSVQGEEAVEALCAALVEGCPPVRVAAARALGCIGDPRAVPPLQAALGDSAESVRAAAVAALRALRQPVPATSDSLPDAVSFTASGVTAS